MFPQHCRSNVPISGKIECHGALNFPHTQAYLRHVEDNMSWPLTKSSECNLGCSLEGLWTGQDELN